MKKVIVKAHKRGKAVVKGHTRQLNNQAAKEGAGQEYDELMTKRAIPYNPLAAGDSGDVFHNDMYDTDGDYASDARRVKDLHDTLLENVNAASEHAAMAKAVAADSQRANDWATARDMHIENSLRACNMAASAQRALDRHLDYMSTAYPDVMRTKTKKAWDTSTIKTDKQHNLADNTTIPAYNTRLINNLVPSEDDL